MAKEKKGKGTLSPLERAKSLQTDIVKQVSSIDLDVKDYAQSKKNVSQIFKINAGLKAAQYSGERDLGITVSSSKNIKEVIAVLDKASGVMDYLLNQTAYLTKRGDTDEAIKMIKEQAELQKSLDEMVGSMDKTINTYLEKGYGRKAAINEFNEAKSVEKIEAAIKLYKSGKKFSEVAEESGLSVEVLVDKCGPYKADFFEANKKEIEKQFYKEQNLKQIADFYEVKIKHLRATMIQWAVDDQKLAKLLETYFETEKASQPVETGTVPVAADEATAIA